MQKEYKRTEKYVPYEAVHHYLVLFLSQSIDEEDLFKRLEQAVVLK